MNTIDTTPQWVTESRREIILSHSLVNTFNSCPRRFEFTVLWNRVLPHESSFAADVGTALHEGLQKYLILRDSGEEEATAQALGYLECLKHYPWKDTEEQTRDTRDVGNTLLLLETMMNDPFWEEYSLVKTSTGEFGVEIPFLIDFPGLDFEGPEGVTYSFGFQGKIDLIMQHKESGEVAVIDIKTSALAAEAMEPTHYFSGQQVGYNQVVQKMLGESAKSFTAHYACYLFTSLGPEAVHLPIEKTGEALEDYQKNLYDTFLRLRRYVEESFFPRTNSGCVAWGRPCTYFPVCKRRDSEFISAWFAEHGAPWNRVYDYKAVVTSPLKWKEDSNG